MVRFLKEACVYSNTEVNTDKLDAIITAAGVGAYAEKYEGDGNIMPVTDYLYSASYVIYNGVVSYRFTLKDATYAETVKFYIGDNEIGATVHTETAEEGGRTYLLLDTMRVYDIIDEITIEVGEATATYSILDYIEVKPESNLAKALYEFGVAAENYKAYLENL